MYEDPRDLLGRLALGREELCQRLLTMLVLGGEYPRWNTRSTPTADGTRFLLALDELSFGDGTLAQPFSFVDELELAPRNPLERGGAPDYGVLSDDRVWLIELKTEAASHRADQIPSYFRLAGHHFPQAAVDITYLTPPLSKRAPETGPGQRYAHVTWDQVVPLVQDAWGSSTDAGVVRVRDGLLRTLSALDVPVAQWRAASAAVGSPAPVDLDLDLALVQARQTAEDGAQRVVDLPAEDLQALQDLRMDVESALAVVPALRHVKPWLWSAASSGGRALSASGAEHGFELRLSRYDKPVR